MNTFTSHSTWPRLMVSGAIMTLVASLAACGDNKARTPSQVALTVNGEEVSVHQVDLALQRQGGNAVERSDAATRRVLEGVIEQEVAAQAARKDGLDRDPRVLQAMEAARREVLARAYQDKLAERVNEPSSDEIDRYYESHPQLFAQRRLFQLQETWVNVAGEGFEPLKARLQATSTPAQVADALRSASLTATVRQLSISAEDVPMPVLERLAALKDGQSIVLPRDGGARVLTVLNAQLAPVQRHAARRAIAAFLVNERKTRLMKEGVGSLRDQAKVEFQGRFATLGSKPMDGASAAASAPITR